MLCGIGLEKCEPKLSLLDLSRIAHRLSHVVKVFRTLVLPTVISPTILDINPIVYLIISGTVIEQSPLILKNLHMGGNLCTGHFGIQSVM